MRLLKLAIPLMALLSFGAVQAATDLSEPQGSVLLEVSGAIEHTNSREIARFDEALLRQLDWREIETFTSFTEGPQRFAGPTLASLLRAVGARGRALNAMAINDYFVEIPLSDAEAHDVILAVEMNGQRMRIRNKGPIWVIYPLSEERAALKPFDTQMIWQLNRIEILR